MQNYRIKLLTWTVFWSMSVISLMAAPSALIVIGTTGNETTTNDLANIADEIKTSLAQRGFATNDIEILRSTSLADRVTSERILQTLKRRENLISSDEFWLVLLGFAGRDDQDKPTFQVSGPRLQAEQLKTALNAIPATQFVFVGTSDSGGFIRPLMAKNRTILTATRDQGEVDLPRFPQDWADALKQTPTADWKQIAAKAAEANEKYYADASLAESEHARLGDGAAGTVLEAPFGATALAKPTPKQDTSGSMASVNAADIKVDIHKPNDEWEQQPATPETKKLIAEAKIAPNPDGFNAIMLEYHTAYKVSEDRTAEDYTLKRIYIEKEDGVERWANFMLPQDPPAVTSKLDVARIIQPDGSSTVFNPAKMPKVVNPAAGEGALAMIFMPNAHAGCLVEIAYRTQYLLSATTPQFTEEMPVQQDIPVLKAQLQLQIAEHSGLFYKLRNSDTKPGETKTNGVRTVTWNFDSLPAYESLPNDPPQRDFVTLLDISSLDSWDSFANWYRRLTRGSDSQDDAVRQKAVELADGAKTRTDKIRKAFEFVSALRYVAIECGINGIRPRTPSDVLKNRYGDCKDKANLLIALLTDMNVDARFCLLNRGSSTDTSFPSWQFNHAIAYVPKSPGDGQTDDLWLDTTDSTAPFPTLAPGDVGRAALVFDKTTAEFHTVAAAGKEVTEINEHWQMKQSSDGTWNGTLKCKWSGLAEYDVRAHARGASPRQREYGFQGMLGGQLDTADFTNIKLTPTDDLSIPLELNAQVSSPGIPNPSTGFKVSTYFASPERNRPLLINNGQKMHVTQVVDLSFTGNPPQTPANFDQTVAGIHAQVKWDKAGDNGWQRTAELDITQPLVAQADYAPVRRLLREWNNRLAP